MVVQSRKSTASTNSRRWPLVDLLNSLRLLWGTALGAAPGKFVLDLIMEPIGFLSTVVLAWLLKLMTDSASTVNPTVALGAAFTYALVLGLMFLFQGIAARMRMSLGEQVHLELDARLARLVGSARDLRIFDHPDLLDRLELVRKEQNRISEGPGMLVLTFAHFVRLVASVGLLGTVHPALLTLPLFALVPVLTTITSEHILREVEREAAAHRSKAQHIVNMVTSPSTSKEVRIYRSETVVLERYLEATALEGSLIDMGNWRYSHRVIIGWLVFGVGFTGTAILLVWLASQGRASPGDLVMAIYLAGTLSGHISNVMWAFSGLAAMLRVADHYVELERNLVEMPTNLDAQVPVPSSLSKGIVLERVSFRYPGTDKWVLRDVTLELPGDSVVAIVGENGAGKTTLVKLLLGLYAPTKGRILVEGIDMRKMNMIEWRLRCSAVFQDFARFELLLRQSIGVGDLRRMEDKEAILAAMRRSDSLELLDELPKGLDTQLGSTWSGIDLSGGQWQKVALSRGLMRTNPLLLVLDEPTAALDAETEYSLFHRHSETALRRKGAGMVTLFVTHRFSTVRMSDQIVVLHDGRVSETGTYEELMQRSGLFAELYELQARSYSS